MFVILEPSTKHCWSWNRVYVKSNGRVPCWCDSGEPYTVVNEKFDTSDFITDIVNAPAMRKMRLDISRDSQYFIKECKSCCCMLEQDGLQHKRYKDSDIASDVSNRSNNAMSTMHRVANTRGWELGSIDHITEIQLEPSFPCNLKCPGCLHGWHPDPISSEVPPYVFPLTWFKLMLNSIIKHNVKLDRIAFVGRGEPTLNRQLGDIIVYSKTHCPNVILNMDTNCNSVFKDEYLEMDWINCSIDGSFARQYAKYRVNGSFDKAITFLKTAAERKKVLNKNCLIRWKYILFNTTESEVDLNRAQKIAVDFQIDELDLVITACGGIDKDITPPQVLNTLQKVNDYISANKIFPNTIVSRS